MNGPPAVDWEFVLKVVQFGMTIFIGVYVWITNQNKVTNDRIETLKHDTDKRLDAVESTQAGLKERVANMPSREALSRLHQRLDDVQSAQSEVRGELKGIHKTVDLIHKHMMEGDK